MTKTFNFGWQKYIPFLDTLDDNKCIPFLDDKKYLILDDDKYTPIMDDKKHWMVLT